METYCSASSRPAREWLPAFVAAQQIQDKWQEHKLDLYVTFINLVTEFDTVSWSQCWSHRERLNSLRNILSVTWQLCDGTCGRIHFQTTEGLFSLSILLKWDKGCQANYTGTTCQWPCNDGPLQGRSSSPSKLFWCLSTNDGLNINWGKTEITSQPPLEDRLALFLCLLTELYFQVFVSSLTLAVFWMIVPVLMGR